MSTKDKLIKRFQLQPKDFTFEEMKSLLTKFGYTLSNKGKTSGSRVSFFKDSNPNPITFHKPHDSIMKSYVMSEVLDALMDNGDISND